MSNKDMETLSTKVEKPVYNLLNQTATQTSTQKKDCVSIAIILFAIESGIISEDQVFDYLPEWMVNTFDLANRTVNRNQMKELKEQNKALFDLLISFRAGKGDKEYIKNEVAKIKLRDQDQFEIDAAVREVQFQEGNDFARNSQRDRELLKTYCIVYRDEIDQRVLELKRAGKDKD